METKSSKNEKFLEEMCHPDGEISFFNDAAIGIAPSKDKLLKYGKELECLQLIILTSVKT